MKEQDKINAYLTNLLDEAKKKVQKTQDDMCIKLTNHLRKKYKGKIVKCKCFDSWTDGDDHYFDQKLIDIQVFLHPNNDFYISVSFMINSMGGKPDEKPFKASYYLESIESIT